MKIFNITKQTRNHLLPLLILCIVTIPTLAQDEALSFLDIGDIAPPLRLREWIKGAPVRKFEKSQIYVLEFWATWCKPCIAAMPHLSALAAEYKGKVTFLGIDVYEAKATSTERIRAFVDSMGHRMNYAVGIQDSNFMLTSWLNAFGAKEEGIPRSFVVNGEGKVAWIGHPHELAEVLNKIVNDTWDIKEALANRNLKKYLEKLEDSLAYEFIKYNGNPENVNDLGKPDSALFLINEIVKKELRLKYHYYIANETFSALLKTNPLKAYEFGKEVLEKSTFEDPTYQIITGAIHAYLDKLQIPPEVYRLGAEAYQMAIDYYPETIDIPSNYHKMADCFWHASDKPNAIDAEEKAIAALKGWKGKSNGTIEEFESRLGQYKKK